MRIVKSFEVNTSEMPIDLLVATQGSLFKDSLLSNIISAFKDRAYVKVIDVNQIQEEDVLKWDAICIMHTFEYWKPPASIEKFFRSNPNLDHVVVFTSSGNGNYKMDEVDAITGASIIEEVTTISTEINTQLETIINKNLK